MNELEDTYMEIIERVNAWWRYYIYCDEMH